jgi:hypothetical protein
MPVLADLFVRLRVQVGSCHEDAELSEAKTRDEPRRFRDAHSIVDGVALRFQGEFDLDAALGPPIQPCRKAGFLASG